MTLAPANFNQIEEIFDKKLDEKIKNLPTKKEFFGAMDALMGEVKTSREEQEVLGHQTTNHEKRISDLETAIDSPAN